MEKVNIEITDGHTFVDGGSFTDVSFMARSYGGGSPCKNEEEVQRAIKHDTSWIKYEGDIPIVEDKRAKAGLLKWL